MLSYSKQYIDKKDKKAVLEVLASDFLTQGPKIQKFENKISKKLNSKYSVVVNSATSALHISCLALNLKKNDILWTVPNTFVASANCGLYCGAKIDFVDIDLNTLNISIEKLEIKLSEAKKKNLLPKVIVPVDFAGNPYNHKALKILSKKYNFKILEDASHAFGSKIGGKFISPKLGSDIVVFSFHPVKPFTSAEGGVAVTNDKKIYERLITFRNHGITKDKNIMKKKQYSSWYFEQNQLGFNYRMNDLQAALGLSQLNKLDKFNLKRNQNARYYLSNLNQKFLNFQVVDKKNFSTYHLFVIIFPNEKKIINNYDKIFREFLKYKVNVQLHYHPVHLHPYYKQLGFKKGSFPVSENYARRAFSIPNYYSLNKLNKNKVIRVINKIYRKYCK